MPDVIKRRAKLRLRRRLSARPRAQAWYRLKDHMEQAEKHAEDDDGEDRTYAVELATGGQNVVRALTADVHVLVTARADFAKAAQASLAVHLAAMVVTIRHCAPAVGLLRADVDGHFLAAGVDLALLLGVD